MFDQAEVEDEKKQQIRALKEADPDKGQEFFDSTTDPASRETKGNGVQFGKDRKTGRTIVLREKSTDGRMTLEEQRKVGKKTRSREIRIGRKGKKKEAN